MLPASIKNRLEILPMTSGDMEDIIFIEKLSFPVPWTISLFEKEIQNSISGKFTAKIFQDGKRIIAAYIVLWAVADEGHILNIATHPDFRRKGIARELLNFALNYLKDREIGKVFLEVRKSNVVARKLYANIGFKDISVRKGYYENNKEDAIVMALYIEDSKTFDFDNK